MYSKSEFYDLTLKLKDGTVVKVHKFVVCQSPFFEAACTSGFKVSPKDLLHETDTDGHKESIENTIEFPEDSPRALHMVVIMLYGYSWMEAWRMLCPEEKPFPISLLPKAKALADKYQLPLLGETLVAELERVLTFWAFAGLHDWVWELAAQVYATDDHTLEMRKILLATLRVHAKEYAKKPELVKEKLSQIPMLAIELAMSGGFDGKTMVL